MTIEHMQEQQQLVARRMKLHVEAMERENRPETPEDTKRLADYKAEIESWDKRIAFEKGQAAIASQADETWQKQHGGSPASAARGRSPGSSAGALFAEGTAEFFKGGHHRTSGTWRSPAVDIPYASLFATTLTEDPASGGKLVIPAYQPGIVPTATRPIVVMDLLMPGTTDSNVVTYMQETSFTNAAAPVAEGIAKPESALVFTQVPEPVAKIAHWLPVTEELLEDAPAIRSYIDGRLRLGVELAADDQVLNGNGTAPNLRGLLNRTGLATTVVQGVAPDTAADAILRQIGAITTTALVAPTGIVMNPADWFALQPLKDTTGQYIGRNPFEAPAPPSLWGLPVAVTSAIAAKTAFVGAFATQAQFFRRGGLRVDSSNSHADFYIRDLVAIRAEQRGALCCYRPGSFGKVTLL